MCRQKMDDRIQDTVKTAKFVEHDTRYSTVIKQSSPYALNVVISQLELLICSDFQF